MSDVVTTAMVLGAGLGNRMRPLTDTVPKPLVNLSGRPLIDHVLDRLEIAGISRAVVNMHYKADVLQRHLASRSSPKIVLSDERDTLLDTGGGVVRALPLLGDKPFLVHNCDSVWIEGQQSNLRRLIGAWDPERMDIIMLLARRETSLGYAGDGDFVMSGDGLLERRARGESAPYVFAGVSIATPRLFEGLSETPFSLNVVWDRVIAHQRLFGIVLDGRWMHVGTPKALLDAESLIAENLPGECR